VDESAVAAKRSWNASMRRQIGERLDLVELRRFISCSALRRLRLRRGLGLGRLGALGDLRPFLAGVRCIRP
jgi:hypothetical protein